MAAAGCSNAGGEGGKASLAALAACLGVATGATAGRGSLDAIMDEFIEEHSRCYEFREHRARLKQSGRPPSNGEEDRYCLVFHALQREFCRMTRMAPATSSRPRTLRVLQCLRLLTREPELQLAFFEGQRGHPTPREARVAAPAPPPAPPPLAGCRISPSRRRATTMAQGEQRQLPRRSHSLCTSEEFLRAESERVRLPPLESSADATSALLRLLTELVAEYVAEAEDSEATHAADASAGAGLGHRLGAAVAGLCIAEILGMVNRYASTEARRARLAQLGTLQPLTCLLCSAGDALVLRCSLETLVHFSVRRNTVVLSELTQLALREPEGLLQECVRLLRSCEELHAALAAQLLEQLLEAPELRLQLRQLQAVGAVVGCVAAEEPRKAVHLLRCCQRLARDHVEQGSITAVQELRRHGALAAALGLLGHSEAEVQLACLETLAQMCMDDDCATALREQHPEGFAAVGMLLLNGESGASVRCAAARLLRFMFAVERNRRALKHLFPIEVLGPFIDVGGYVWPLEAYEQVVRVIGDLGAREVALLRDGFHRHSGSALRLRRASTESGPRAHDSPRSSEPGTPGRAVCGYELVECVGSGAFGNVHLARRLDRAGDFALKEVPLTDASARPSTPSCPPTPACPSSPTKPRLVSPGHLGEGAVAQEPVAKSISQEVRLLRQLDHSNIVHYYSSFTTSSEEGGCTLWIVMEYCSGASLDAFTASAREKGLAKLPEEQTWQVFVQICMALRYLHVEKGITHRDLTPNNVLVQPRTLAVKLVDFGLARQKPSSVMMQSVVGTVLYSCPEIVQQRPYTHKADVWALGCLLYKMSTLREAFQGGNPLSVARRIVECDYVRLDASQHSQMLVHTCESCLTVQSEARPDIQEVCQLIMPALFQHLEAVQRLAFGDRQQLAAPTQRPLAATSPSPHLASEEHIEPVEPMEPVEPVSPKRNWQMPGEESPSPCSPLNSCSEDLSPKAPKRGPRTRYTRRSASPAV